MSTLIFEQLANIRLTALFEYFTRTNNEPSHRGFDYWLAASIITLTVAINGAP